MQSDIQKRFDTLYGEFYRIYDIKNITPDTEIKLHTIIRNLIDEVVIFNVPCIDKWCEFILYNFCLSYIYDNTITGIIGKIENTYKKNCIYPLHDRDIHSCLFFTDKANAFRNELDNVLDKGIYQYYYDDRGYFWFNNPKVAIYLHKKYTLDDCRKR